MAPVGLQVIEVFTPTVVIKNFLSDAVTVAVPPELDRFSPLYVHPLAIDFDTLELLTQEELPSYPKLAVNDMVAISVPLYL